MKDGSLVFSDGSREAAAKELPSLELINYTLTYAKNWRELFSAGVCAPTCLPRLGSHEYSILFVAYQQM